MNRSVISRVVAALITTASVVGLGLVVSPGGHDSATHQSVQTGSATMRDRGWCC